MANPEILRFAQDDKMRGKLVRDDREKIVLDDEKAAKGDCTASNYWTYSYGDKYNN